MQFMFNKPWDLNWMSECPVDLFRNSLALTRIIFLSNLGCGISKFGEFLTIVLFCHCAFTENSLILGFWKKGHSSFEDLPSLSKRLFSNWVSPNMVNNCFISINCLVIYIDRRSIYFFLSGENTIWSICTDQYCGKNLVSVVHLSLFPLHPSFLIPLTQQRKAIVWEKGRLLCVSWLGFIFTTKTFAVLKDPIIKDINDEK